MDFNDIKKRLERTLSSMSQRFDDKVIENTNSSINESEEEILFSVEFGNASDEDILNKIFLIFHNLASLKDHLKNCLKGKGKDPKIVEREIDGSLHLQVLIDLVNQEKHGYPLTKTIRSGKNPLVKNYKQILALNTGNTSNGVAGFFMDLSGKVSMLGEDNSINIYAEIYDDKGTMLFGLDELVDTCYSKFAQIAADNNCI